MSSTSIDSASAPVQPTKSEQTQETSAANLIQLPGTVVVDANRLSKQFVLRSSGVGDLRERFQDVWSQMRRRQTHDERTFWALQDISFQVSAGQTLGIVGHNGSGKSTLLKMLTGILKPTSGSLKMKGRIGALIEVGAGFHPDLSGRENVYLNGSILGLSRRDIERRMDTIVSFAGLEKFIDTPVKRYSSGMYMRLGFSVAAHTDPDILLIDEVLAVGDSQFQRKCLRHLKDFAARGGTVIFVSHAMGQVVELCRTCLWLDHGEVLYQGDAQQAVDRYMALVAAREEEEYRRNHPEEWAERQHVAEQEKHAAEEAQRASEEGARQQRLLEEEAQATRSVQRNQPTACRVDKVVLTDLQGRERSQYIVGEPVQLHISYHFGRSLTTPVLGIDFFREDGLHMYTTSNYDHQLSLANLPSEGTVTLDIAQLTFNKGTYTIVVKLFGESLSEKWHDHPEDLIDPAARFEIVAGRFGLGIGYLPSRWQLPDGSFVAGEPVSQAVRQDIERQVSGTTTS